METLQQAPAQQREYGSFDHPEVKPKHDQTKRPDPEPEMKILTFKNKSNPIHSNKTSFSKSSALMNLYMIKLGLQQE